MSQTHTTAFSCHSRRLYGRVAGICGRRSLRLRDISIRTQDMMMQTSEVPSSVAAARGVEDQFETHGWRFTSRNGPILSSAREANVSSDLDIKLPAMLFDDNYLEIKHERSHFQLSFCARAALRHVGRADPTIQVKAANSWRDRPYRSKAGILENASDWTFTTHYPGTTLFVSSIQQQSSKTTDIFSSKHSRDTSKQYIDYASLRNVDVPILFFKDMILFEDELDDNGVSIYRVRIRVMPNCFFVLARFFLRVDGVLLRCYDTRYFHDFETDVVVRERLRREADYASLERRVSSHVLRDPEQIVNFIPEVDKVVDNVKLKNISGCKDSTDDSCP